MAGWNPNTRISDTISTNVRMTPGVGHTPDYQSSGMPFIVECAANTTTTIDFEFVTRAITLIASGSDATFHLGDADSTTASLPQQSSLRVEVKSKKLVVTTPAGVTVSVIAELTGIPASKLPQHDHADLGTVS